MGPAALRGRRRGFRDSLPEARRRCYWPGFGPTSNRRTIFPAIVSHSLCKIAIFARERKPKSRRQSGFRHASASLLLTRALESDMVLLSMLSYTSGERDYEETAAAFGHASAAVQGNGCRSCERSFLCVGQEIFGSY